MTVFRCVETFIHEDKDKNDIGRVFEEDTIYVLGRSVEVCPWIFSWNYDMDVKHRHVYYSLDGDQYEDIVYCFLIYGFLLIR